LSSEHEVVDHPAFVRLLTREFPEVTQAFDEYSKGLLHCEMGILAGIAEKAMDDGRFSQVDKYFRFINSIRERAAPDVENATDVSFIEYFVVGEFTKKRAQAIRRMPRVLRTILMEMDGRGRWA